MIAETFSEVLEVILTEDEIKKLSEENNTRVLERASVKAKAKKSSDGFTLRIKSLDHEIERIAEILKEGKDTRPVECEWRADLLTREMYAVRLDTFDVLRRRSMDADERREYLQGKLWESDSSADETKGIEDTVAEFFDDVKSNVVTPDEITIDGSASQIFTEDKEETEGEVKCECTHTQSRHYRMGCEDCQCEDFVPKQKTEISADQSEPRENDIEVPPEPETLLLDKKVAPDPSKPGIRGVTGIAEQPTHIIIDDKDEFTASRCGECNMIDGGHAPTCSKSNTVTYDDYFAWAKANKKKHPASFARKMEVTSDPEVEAQVREWKKERATKERAANATV